MARLLILLLTLLPLTLRAGQPLATAEGQILVCGHSNYPPISWTEHNALHGMGPALARQILNRLGYEVKLVDIGNWKRCLYEVKAGRVDLVAGAFKDAQRVQDMTFGSEYIIEEPIMLFVNKDNPIAYRNWDDLRGKTVGLLLGDIYGERFDRFLVQNTQIEWVSFGAQNLGKLARERIDFTPIGTISGQLQARKLGLDQSIEPLPEVVTTGFFYFGIAHNSPLRKQLPQIDAELRRLRASGAVDRLLEQASADYLGTR